MRIHYLQHVPFEGPAMIATWANARGYSLSNTALYEHDHSLPSLDEFDMLVVMGGPMSVHDEAEYAWLASEKALITQAIEQGKHVLGICLGAQLIAQVLGANVVANEQKEIGWFPINWQMTQDTLSPTNELSKLFNGLANPMTVLHWYGERFEIPSGAQHIASSKACHNQGFLYQNTVLGLQFHLEMNSAAIDNILNACGDELVNGAYIQNEAQIRDGYRDSHRQRTHNTKPITQDDTQHYLTENLFQLLDNWLNMPKTHSV